MADLFDSDDLAGLEQLSEAGRVAAGEEEEVAHWVERSERRSSATLSALSAYQRAAEEKGSLTPEQQLALAAEYRVGIEAKKALDSDRVRTGDLRRARQLARQAEVAMERLTASCWRLAWLIVRENAEARFGKDKASTMLPDLMNEANMALVEAVRKFDPTKTPAFATYAAREIRDHVRVVLSREGQIQLAPSWNRIKRIAAARIPELTTELGRHPSKEEIKAALTEACLEWAERKLTDDQRLLSGPERHQIKLAKLRKQGMLGAIRDIDEVLAMSQSVASLDQPVGEEGGTTLGELIPGQSGGGLFDQVELGELRDALGTALATLSDRERDIVLLRFGFVDNESWTYAKIAERYDVTAERIRQIERAVLSKLASPHGAFSALATFLPTQF